MEGIDARNAKGLQVGDNNTQNNYYRERPEPSWPHEVGVIPPLADCRQSRAADDRLTETAAVTQVLSGLGGVGKTQLAVGLVRRLQREQRIDLLIWVNATSRDSILARYAEAADHVIEAENEDRDQAAARLLTWLANTKRKWLVVLDNLDDPDDLTGLWPPETTWTGRTVVTTRRRDSALAEGRDVIDVDLFTADEAADYLRAKLARVARLADDVAGVAEDLGHLPLALAQAGAYMLDLKVPCTEYRERFATRLLADLRPLSLPDQHREIIAATWQLSIKAADRLSSGVSGPVLKLAALLDPNGIPCVLFAADRVTGHCSGETGHAVTAADIRDALQVLHRLSLAAVDDDDAPAMHVHSLVQRAVRDDGSPAENEVLGRVAADALCTVWTKAGTDLMTAQILRANTGALERRQRENLLHPVPHEVLYLAVESLAYFGLWDAALADLGRLVQDCLRIVGPEHEATLMFRSHHVRMRGRTGDFAGAVAAATELLEVSRSVFGPHHPNNYTLRSDITIWRAEAGDLRGGADAAADLYEDHRSLFGDEDPGTLTIRANLLQLQAKAGIIGAASAADAFAELLESCVRRFGLDSPEILTVRASVAHWRGAAGDRPGAAQAYRHLVDDYRRVLGPDSRETLHARNNLARWYVLAGDPAQAAEAFQELLDEQVRVLGPDHRDVATTRTFLGMMRAVLEYRPQS